ncbi:MAG: hypothetical protein ACFFGP_16745 [Promethearchaeota archaeon]
MGKNAGQLVKVIPTGLVPNWVGTSWLVYNCYCSMMNKPIGNYITVMLPLGV